MLQIRNKAEDGSEVFFGLISASIPVDEIFIGSFSGKYAMPELLAVLPAPSSPEGEEEPSEYTICAVLGTLQVLTHGALGNCK